VLRDMVAAQALGSRCCPGHARAIFRKLLRALHRNLRTEGEVTGDCKNEVRIALRTPRTRGDKRQAGSRIYAFSLCCRSSVPVCPPAPSASDERKPDAGVTCSASRPTLGLDCPCCAAPTCRRPRPAPNLPFPFTVVVAPRAHPPGTSRSAMLCACRCRMTLWRVSCASCAR
jgi:hypothetical protein